MQATDYANMLFSRVHKEKDRTTIIRAFIHFIYNNGDLSLLPDTIRILDEREQSQRSTKDVTVRIAHDLDATELKKIVARIIKTDDFTLNIQRDEKLLGGMTIETRNRIWDMSLRHQLNKLNLRLTQSL